MDDFLDRLGKVLVSLEQSLRINLEPDGSSPYTIVQGSIARLFRLHNESNQLLADFELARLGMFALDLKLIGRKAPELLRQYRKQLRKIERHESFFGIRFEVRIAASFLGKGYSITKRESPDFVVTINDESVFLECTSVRFDHSKDRDAVLYKIGRAVREKVHKRYLCGSTALLIDWTNVCNFAVKYNLMPESGEIPDYVGNLEYEGDDPGSVVLFMYYSDVDNETFGMRFHRVDYSGISPTLRIILDDAFPPNEGFEQSGEKFIPREG